MSEPRFEAPEIRRRGVALQGPAQRFIEFGGPLAVFQTLLVHVIRSIASVKS